MDLDTYLYEKITQAWKRTIQLATPQGRQEVGFYIYYNFSDKRYWVGDMVEGPVTRNEVGTSASVSLGEPVNEIQVCAFFHTHTPMKYAHGDRKTGPSEADIAFATSKWLPGILIDHPAPVIEADLYRAILSEEAFNDYIYQYIIYIYGPESRGSSTFIQYPPPY